mgnify:CR=1 FL=1
MLAFPLGGAAALGKLGLDAIGALHDGHVGAILGQGHLLAQLSDVALHLVAEVTDAVADVGEAVVDQAKLLTEKDLLLRCGRGVLAELALAVAPAVVPEAEHKEEENDNQKPAGTPAVLIVCAASNSGDIAEGHGIQINQSFRFLLQTVAHQLVYK